MIDRVGKRMLNAYNSKGRGNFIRKLRRRKMKRRRRNAVQHNYQ
jgi:hypothetical protein